MLESLLNLYTKPNLSCVSNAIPPVEISYCLYAIVTFFMVAIKNFKKLAEKTAPPIEQVQ